MTKFNFFRHDADELGRITPVARITDKEVFDHLLTPVVKTLLGPIVSGQIDLTDKAKMVIPEDVIFNIHGHRMFGEHKDVARFPYNHSEYRTENGVVIIRRDGIKLEVLGWYGDVARQKGQLVWRVALRDRKYDGTPAANDCALEHFPYDHPQLNPNFFPKHKSVEFYLFTYSPGSTVLDASGDQELHDFIAQPFHFVDRPELFMQLFKKAWASNRAPGQYSGAIQDASKLMETSYVNLVRKRGYDVVEVAASHYHVAMWCVATGYQVSDPAFAKTFHGLRTGIQRIKSSGKKLTRPHESWLVVLQSMPRELIPDDLYLDGYTWPQDNVGLSNLWFWKHISAKEAPVPVVPEP